MLSESLLTHIHTEIAVSTQNIEALAIDGYLLRALLLEQWTPEIWRVHGFRPAQVRQIRKHYGLIATRREPRLTFHGITKTAEEWLADTEHHPSVTPKLFTMRAHAGWTLHRALTTPKREKSTTMQEKDV